MNAWEYVEIRWNTWKYIKYIKNRNTWNYMKYKNMLENIWKHIEIHWNNWKYTETHADRSAHSLPLSGSPRRSPTISDPPRRSKRSYTCADILWIFLALPVHLLRQVWGVEALGVSLRKDPADDGKRLQLAGRSVWRCFFDRNNWEGELEREG